MVTVVTLYGINLHEYMNTAYLICAHALLAVTLPHQFIYILPCHIKCFLIMHKVLVSLILDRPAINFFSGLMLL